MDPEPLMQPLPETREVIERLNRAEPEADLLGDLLDAGAKVSRIVPDCVGLSLAYVESGVTLTLVASDAHVAVLDAVQPVADASRADAGADCGETDSDGLLDEERWLALARASAAAGVSSTLSLPIRQRGRLIGGVNLYGGSEHAFTGHHQELAQVLGAWADGAVTNADLPFRTRAEAVEAPTQLDRSSDINVAVGIVAASRGVTTEQAYEQLRSAAEDAGVEEWELAEVVRELGGL